MKNHHPSVTTKDIATKQSGATSSASPDDSNVLRFRAALALVQPEIDAVPDADLVGINLDIPTASMAVLGRVPRIMSFRDQVAKEMPSFDISAFDKLERYTEAVSCAHTDHQMASTPTEPIADLTEELTNTRDMLLADVAALVKRKLLDGSRLDQLTGQVGYKNVAYDVMALSTLLRSNWAAISAKTAITLDELDRADRVAEQLTRAVGLRNETVKTTSAASVTRQRAFTLFVNAYDEVVRAMTFLRWHERDVDTIAPSLYAHRAGSRKKAEETAPAAPPPPAPEPDHAAPAPRVPDTSAGFTAPGMPGNDPFGR